jgi:hypothetical protein
MALASSHSQCVRHPGRPAVARCLGCQRSYCRECVVEHGGRRLCAECLRGEAESAGRRGGGGWWRSVPWAAMVQWMAAAAVMSTVFWVVIWIFSRIPAEGHDGIKWNQSEPR